MKKQMTFKQYLDNVRKYHILILLNVIVNKGWQNILKYIGWFLKIITSLSV